jgi:hypothetical protein
MASRILRSAMDSHLSGINFSLTWRG